MSDIGIDVNDPRHPQYEGRSRPIGAVPRGPLGPRVVGYYGGALDWIESGDPVSVQSTNVAWIQYFKEQEVLFIGYHRGGAYSYRPVPPDVAEALFTARSVGTYARQKVRFGGFLARKE